MNTLFNSEVYWDLFAMGTLIFEFLFLFLFFFSIYHNKIHLVTNYKSVRNKIDKTRQHRTFF